MKLIYRIVIRLFLFLSIILTFWAALFYIALMDEINDETDDSLEDYSEQIIIHLLAGEELPSKINNSNNQYYLSEVTSEYAHSKPNISYVDSMVYILSKNETDPARVLTTIYKNGEGKYYELVVSVPTIEKNDLKEAILYWIIFLYIGLLFVIIPVNIWIYHRSNRPLYKLLVWMDEYKVGGKNIPLENETDITEFKKLNEATVRNMKRAEEVFEKQKQFIGNASHEMQTPVAICRNRIESLMEEESFTENQLENLAKIHHTLEYITKLNKSLLLLSKIDNGQFADASDIEMSSLIKKFIHDYEEVYSYMNIALEVKGTGIFKIRINQSLAGILINNLIKNSYVHNISNGHVYIEMYSSKIVFKNTGQDLPLNDKLIFERFYQGTKKEGSTGLGLALVKSICDMAKLNLNYYFEDNMHCFEIHI